MGFDRDMVGMIKAKSFRILDAYQGVGAGVWRWDRRRKSFGILDGFCEVANVKIEPGRAVCILPALRARAREWRKVQKPGDEGRAALLSTSAAG